MTHWSVTRGAHGGPEWLPSHRNVYKCEWRAGASVGPVVKDGLVVFEMFTSKFWEYLVRSDSILHVVLHYAQTVVEAIEHLPPPSDTMWNRNKRITIFRFRTCVEDGNRNRIVDPSEIH